MATESKTPAVTDSPQLAHYKFQEKELVRALKDLEGKTSEPGFDYETVKVRTEALLAEVRKEIKALTK